MSSRALPAVASSEDFAWFEDYFPAIEARNSHMLESANGHAAHLATQWNKIAIGGSDAHALPSVGTAYTEVPGAQDKEEFFAGLRSGMGRVAGESGSFAKLTRDVFLIAVEMMREKILDRRSLRRSLCSFPRSPSGIIATNIFSAAAGRRRFSISPSLANVPAGSR